MDTQYTRSSIVRKNKYRVMTTILKDTDGTMLIEKRAESDLAKDHLLSLTTKYEQLSKHMKGFELHRQTLVGDGVRSEYIDGELYEDQVTKAFLHGKYDVIISAIDQVLTLIESQESREITSEEKQHCSNYFGSSPLLKGEGIICGYIDFNLDNIIIKNDTLHLIDYEWVFDFPVPKKYVQARLLLNVLVHMQSLFNSAASPSLAVHETSLGLLVPEFMYVAFKKVIDTIPQALVHETNFQNEVLIIQDTPSEPQSLTIAKTHTEPVNNTAAALLPQVISRTEELQAAIKELDAQILDAKDAQAKTVFEKETLNNELNRIKSSKIWPIIKILLRI